MGALSRAIDQALESPPQWTAVPDEASLPGLRRRGLSALDVLATSVGAIKPAATSLVAPIIVTSYVGPGAWLSILLAFAVAWLLRGVIEEFTARIVTTGSLYTFVVRGLGAWAGLVTALTMVVAYAFAANYAISAGGLAIRALASGPHSTAAGGAASGAACILLVGVACGAVLVRRVSTFTTLTLVFEVVTVVIVGVLATTVLQRGGDLGAALSLAGADPRAIIGGSTIMLAMLVGFEVSASHGTEASHPFRSVPFAMRAALLAAGLLSLLTVLAATGDHTIAFGGLHDSVRIEHLWFPEGGALEITLFRVGRILCLVASALAFWSAIARLVYVLATEGVLPRALGRTDSSHDAPALAVVCVAPLAIGPGLVLVVLGNDMRTVLTTMLDGAGLIMMVSYLLTCLAIPVFLTRIDEVSPRPVLHAGLVAALVLGAMVSNLTWQDQRGTAGLVAVAGSVVVPLATAWYVVLRLRRSAALHRMGMHDHTIIADTLARSGGR